MNILPQEKIDKLEQGKETIDKLTSKLEICSLELAKAEREYRTALAKEILKYRTRGRNEPGQLAINLAKGTPEVASLRHKRDIARINVDVIKQYIKNFSQQQEILRSMLAYDRATYRNS